MRPAPASARKACHECENKGQDSRYRLADVPQTSDGQPIHVCCFTQTMKFTCDKPATCAACQALRVGRAGRAQPFRLETWDAPIPSAV